MASSKESNKEEAKPTKAPRKTEKVNVWLNPDQAAWLKEKGGPSDTVRALITEAMALDNLRKSVGAKKKSVEAKKKKR